MEGVRKTVFADGTCIRCKSAMRFNFNLVPTRDFILLNDQGKSVIAIPVYPIDIHCISPGMEVKMFYDCSAIFGEKDFVPLLGKASEIFGLKPERICRSLNVKNASYGGYGYAAVDDAGFVITKNFLSSMDFTILPGLCPEDVLNLFWHHDLIQDELEEIHTIRKLPNFCNDNQDNIQDVNYSFEK